MDIRIENYRPEWKQCFERLNKAWLEEYFVVEDIDKWVLENPDEAILKSGGKILFALYDNMVIGTVALRFLEGGECELTKMAVDKKYQGYGAGKLLCKAAIDEAKRLNADKVILYSNTKLSPAIGIYRNLGFMEVEHDNGVYARADIRMELLLREQPEAEEITTAIESYGNAYSRIMACLNDIPKKMWNWQPPYGKWTIHQNIIHLTDSEVNGYIRCRKFIAEPGSTLQSYDQDAWASKVNYSIQSSDEALELFCLLRKLSYDLIKDLPLTIWNNTAIHPERGEMKFWQWLLLYENHTHIGQMKRVYRSWLAAQAKEIV